MKNFGRALRLALRYRWSITAAVACALLVGALWGANIGALYPVVEVVFDNQSVPGWLEEQVEEANQNIVKYSDQAESIEKQLESSPDADHISTLKSDLHKATVRVDAEQQALERYRWFQPYANKYLPDDVFLTLLLIVGFLIVGTLIKGIFLYSSELLVARIANLATLDFRREFYRRTLRLDLASFQEKQTTDLMSRFTGDLGGITGGIQVFFGRTLREPLKLIACVIGAGFVCWRLLLLTMIVVPVGFLMINVLAKSLKRASRRAMEETANLYGILAETFNGIKVVKAFTMERHERIRLKENAKERYRLSMKIARYSSLVSPTTELMGILMISLAILAGAYLAINQETHLLGLRMCYRELSLGDLLLFYGFLIGVTDPARKLSGVFSQLQVAAAASDRVYEMFDREPKVVDPVKAVPAKRLTSELTFENIKFHYEKQTPVLQGVNFTVQAGETIAIVGPNGCGKSTLVNLIPRFFDPVEGTVKIDGIDLKKFKKIDLRRQMGIVTQETLLFNDTVLQNIKYGTPDASEASVIAAAKQAHGHEFIMEKLEQGYDTIVGQQGNRLSGGQRQRIALARAILRDPAILILDEATSQIDIESERLIHQVLAEFTKNRTTILITHRLSSLQLADRILVMDHGKVLDCGSHEELLARCELYQRIYQVDLRKSA